jgi:hypothetical protein
MITAAGGWLRSIFQQLLLLLVSVLLIDIACYWLLPHRVAAKFFDYRMARSVIGAPSGYRPGYLELHSERGHDIGPGLRSTHAIAEISYDIWSNKLGCFDREWDRVPEGYVYFAGDSFTWGYARFEDKFPTLFEKATGRPSLKCGVTNTGTRHQFEKFKEIINRVGHKPALVIVAYFINDIVNDRIFPSTTVVDGWMVDKRYFDADQNIVIVDDNWLREQIAESLSKPPAVKTCTSSMWQWMKCYSATVNVINTMRPSGTSTTKAGTDPGPIWYNYRGTKIRSSYYLPPEIESAFPPLPHPDTGPNLAAIKDWGQHAAVHGYKLRVLLIPPPHAHTDTKYYAELSKYLSGLGIEHHDLTRDFSTGGYSRQMVYWRYDGHFSPDGNRITADVIVRLWGAAK